MANNEIGRKEPIRGKVAGIISERELTINIGSINGVREDMKFKILASEPIEVRDPETGNKLGIVDREKVRVVTMEVQDKFSICKTYRKRTISGVYFPDFAKLFAQPREISETLKINDSSLPKPLPEEGSYVKVGDRVIQLVEEDDE